MKVVFTHSLAEDEILQNSGPEIADIDRVVRMVFGAVERVEVGFYRPIIPEHQKMNGKARCIWEARDENGKPVGVFAYKIQDNLGGAFSATKRTLHDAKLVDLIREHSEHLREVDGIDVPAGIFIFERAIDTASQIWFADCLNDSNPIHFERKTSTRNMNGDYFCIPTIGFPYPWNLHRMDKRSEQSSPALLKPLKPVETSVSESIEIMKSISRQCAAILERLERKS
jgi:hypothetical protein